MKCQNVVYILDNILAGRLSNNKAGTGRLSNLGKMVSDFTAIISRMGDLDILFRVTEVKSA